MYVLSIDAGTTGIRSIAFDESGRIAASAYREFPQHYPSPGLVEHDLEEIWAAVVDTLSKVTQSVGASAIKALGITNQRETACIWDKKTSRPLGRAIVWQDRRTAGRCRELIDAGAEPMVRQRTGLVIDPYFSATKFEWLLQNVAPDDFNDVALGTIDSWILWKLTAGTVHATDWSNASRTMLFDLGSLQWSQDLCELVGVPIELLPQPLPSAASFGETDPAIAGFTAPICGVLGDQQAALFGQCCFTAGMSKNTYGTGSFVLTNVGDSVPPPAESVLTSVAWGIEGKATYVLEGSIFVTGAAIQWLRDGLGIIDDASQTEAAASSVSDTGDVYFVPALTGLGSPWWDPYARGTIVGLSRGTTKDHIIRAVVEAMAYSTRDVVEAIVAASGREVSELRVDGGASAMDLLCQLQADQLGIVVRRPRITETTALGAAYIAGLSSGVWRSLDEVSEIWALDKEFAPTASRHDADRRYSRWLQAVERARGWAIEAESD
jgi:glycerol kinase